VLWLNRPISLIIISLIILQVINVSNIEQATDGFIDASPHLWYRMGQALIKGLYDPDLNLFRETWGEVPGRCWYWNTEQGEALQLLVAMENSTLISEIMKGFMRYLVYDNGDRVWLFTRYTPCRQFRIL